jgi:hypothetical protein
MTVVELTEYLEVDLVFSRGETPAFRLDFTGTDEATIATWVISCEVRRAMSLDVLADWDVTVDGSSVVFSLDDEVTETLPDHCVYQVRLEIASNNVRKPMGGRLLLRSDAC